MINLVSKENFMIIHFLSFLNFAFTLGSLQKQSSGFTVNKLLHFFFYWNRRNFSGKGRGHGDFRTEGGGGVNIKYCYSSLLQHVSMGEIL